MYWYVSTLIPPITLWAIMRRAGLRGNYALPYAGGIFLYSILDPVWQWHGDSSWTWRCALFVVAGAGLGWYDGWMQHKPDSPRPEGRPAIRTAKAAVAGAVAIALVVWIDYGLTPWLAQINHKRVEDLPPIVTINGTLTIPLVLWAFMRVAGERKNHLLLCVAGIAFPMAFAPLCLNVGWSRDLATGVGFVALCALLGWYGSADPHGQPAAAARQ
ncbi:hypothetical protein [Streptomyces sp. NPDC093225]|uniref:hypothetical protein n=1 Tax=Streptomyces sp. NPDC093225 TaxID=3366034 RepID=UPI0037FE362B